MAALFATLLLVAFICLIWWIGYEFLMQDRGMVIHQLDTEASRLASTLFFDKMTALAQLGVGLMGGIWALITLAETNVQVRGWALSLCLSVAIASLCASLLVYALGYDFIVSRIFYHHSFDVDAPYIAFIQKAQQFAFLLGLAGTGITVLLGRRAA